MHETADIALGKLVDDSIDTARVDEVILDVGSGPEHRLVEELILTDQELGFLIHTS